MMPKKIIAFIVLLLMTVSFVSGRNTEVNYPQLNGTVLGNTPGTFFRYLFIFSIATGTILAFVVLVIGGFRYMSSIPEVQSKAKNQIFSALFGLTLLLASYLILTSIYPQFRSFELKQPEALKTGTCNSDTDCPPSYKCKKVSLAQTKRCVLDISCKSDGDCKKGYICALGKCIVNPVCSDSNACPDGFACVDNECIYQRPLEVKYFSISGFAPDIIPAGAKNVTEFLAKYIKYIYDLAIVTGGILAFFSFLLGAFKYLTSAGSPEHQANAKKQMFYSLLGLLILLSSWLFLKTLYPNISFNIIKLETKEAQIIIPDGLWFCEKKINEMKAFIGHLNSGQPQETFDNKKRKIIYNKLSAFCYHVTSSQNMPADLSKEKWVQAVYEIGYYSAVTHSRNDLRGYCEYLIGPHVHPRKADELRTPRYRFSSVSVFIDVFHTEEFLKEPSKFGRGDTYYPERDFQGPEGILVEFDAVFYSMKIDKPKHWVIALSRAKQDQNNPFCEIFVESDYNLEDNYITWAWHEEKREEDKGNPYAKAGPPLDPIPHVMPFVRAPGYMIAPKEEIEEDPCFKPLPPEPEDPTQRLVNGVKNIYQKATAAGGVLAFVFLVIGGLQYLFSAGNVTLQLKAKEQISSAFWGLLILLSSYLILKTLKTDFILLKLGTLAPEQVNIKEGIWLCKKDINGFSEYLFKRSLHGTAETSANLKKEIDRCCYYVNAKENIPESLSAFHEKNNHLWAYSVGDFGAVFHDERNFKGHTEILWENNSLLITKLEGIGHFGVVHSVTPIQRFQTASGEGVTFYYYRDFNEGKENLPFIKAQQGFYRLKPDLEKCYSIKIDKEREWVVIACAPLDLETKEYTGNWCEVFDRSDYNLEDNFTSRFCVERPEGLAEIRYPCIGNATVFPGKIIESVEDIIRPREE